MSHYDPRIDNYIMKSAEFAIPILDFWREMVHIACPDVKETMKWSMPFFEYNNYNVCNMAAFKYHCAFHFWLASKMEDRDKVFRQGDDSNAMGQLGKIKTLEDLPSEEQIIRLIQEAMSLIDQGVRITKDPIAKVLAEVVVPDYFKAEIEQDELAMETFKKFSASQQKEYVNWVTEAKSEATRQKRMTQAVEWMAEGKTRNWKYMQK